MGLGYRRDRQSPAWVGDAGPARTSGDGSQDVGVFAVGHPCISREGDFLAAVGARGASPLIATAGSLPLTEPNVMRLVDHRQLRDQIRRGKGRRGVARLRLLLDEVHPQTRWSRSELERMFLHVCLQKGLPQPEVNVLLEAGDRRFRPDFLWRDARLILEADSRRFHDTDVAFVDDRRREQRLQLAGWRVSHCTWEEVEHEPAVLAETWARGLVCVSAGVGAGAAGGRRCIRRTRGSWVDGP